MGFVAGHYSATLGGANIGGTRDGFNLVNRMHHQPVISDSFGEGEADGIQQGVDVIVECDYIDYDLLNAANGLFTQTGTEGAGNAKVGHTLSSLAQSLILTPIAGTPAAALSTPGYTFPLAIAVDEIPVPVASKLRQGRMRFHCFPNISSGVVYTKQ
jgi:hypothetical protein